MNNTLPEPTEHEHQCAVIDWALMMQGQYPALEWLMAIPNGTRTTPGVARKMVQEGVKRGVADLFLPYPSIGYHGLFIEMKRNKRSRVEPEQLKFRQDMLARGYYAVICHGAADAITTIGVYLGIYKVPHKQEDGCITES